MRSSAAVVISLALLAGCSASPIIQAPSSEAPIILEGSWAYGYQDLAELRASADVVATVRVSGVRSTGPDPADATLAETQFNVDVSEVLVGEAPPRIVIKQSGGTLDGRRYVVGGDPLLIVGDRLLVFLRRVDAGPQAGVYAILGGPQGRFAIDDSGILSTVGEPSIDLPARTTIDEVAAEL